MRNENIGLFGKAGAREYAIVLKLLESRQPKTIYVAPGNDGIEALSKNDSRLVRVPINTTSDWVTLAREKEIDLGFIGPEEPLVHGVVDEFEKYGIYLSSPNKNAARLEGSKSFAKDVMTSLGIPTAEYMYFDDPNLAKLYVDSRDYLVVVKADGLAGGKGVTVCDDIKEAYNAIDDYMIRKKFGEAGERIVIEKRLYGNEFSYFIATDGETVIELEPARDYKQINDGNKGPNTGGIAAYSPNQELSASIRKKIHTKIALPLIQGLKEKYGITYKGICYIGGMLVGNDPKVIEFNVRFGDPETIVMLPRLQTDLVDLFSAIRDGTLGEMEKLQWSNDYYLGIVATSGRTQKNDGSWYEGYPGEYAIGKPIYGLDAVGNGAYVVHANTRLNKNTQQWETDGGRVIAIVAKDKTLHLARKRLLPELKGVVFEGMHYRKDPGERGS